MQLDLFTILAIQAAFSLLVALWLAGYCVLGGRVPGMGWSAAAFALFGVGCLFTAPRGILPDAVTLVGAHGAVCAGMACYHEGLRRQLAAPRTLPGAGVVLCAAGALSALAFGVVHDVQALRIVNLSAITIAFSLIGLWRIRRFGPGRGPLARHMRAYAVLLGLATASSALRIALGLGTGLGQHQILAGALQATPLVLYLLFQVGSAINLAWMSLALPAHAEGSVSP